MFLSHQSPWVLVLALGLDAFIGDPERVWTRLPHPVVVMGRLIAVLDERLNDPAKSSVQRRIGGVLALIVLASIAIGAGLGLETLFRKIPYGFFGIALIASAFLAQRSLYDHIRHVRQAFGTSGPGDDRLTAARFAVARVVGRDPESLDEAGVCRAAIESCAENFSDGVVAPAFWFALFGLPGLFAYKIVNTADSMIGHRTLRYEAFGWASARCDDLLNVVPARLGGVFISCVAPLAGGRFDRAFSIMWRDASQHRSPNAGWPESAMAGALDLALAGPRSYAGQKADEPFLNPAGRVAYPGDITRALRLLIAACCLEVLLYAALALLDHPSFK